MTKTEEQIKLHDKIMKGFDKVYERLVEFKKQKKTELVIIRDGKIIRVKPEELARQS